VEKFEVEKFEVEKFEVEKFEVAQIPSHCRCCYFGLILGSELKVVQGPLELNQLMMVNRQLHLEMSWLELLIQRTRLPKPDWTQSFGPLRGTALQH
jgi:hypothetical protein